MASALVGRSERCPDLPLQLLVALRAATGQDGPQAADPDERTWHRKVSGPLSFRVRFSQSEKAPGPERGGGTPLDEPGSYHASYSSETGISIGRTRANRWEWCRGGGEWPRPFPLVTGFARCLAGSERQADARCATARPRRRWSCPPRSPRPPDSVVPGAGGARSGPTNQ